jgi:uncharacterized protein
MELASVPRPACRGDKPGGYLSCPLCKEFAMATMSPYVTERRHRPDRRAAAAEPSTRSGMNALDWIAMALMIIGGLNWGLVGLFNVDLVASIFGEMSALTRVVYVAVGLSALYSIYTASKMSRRHV